MTAVTRILRRLTGAALCLAAVCGLPGMPAQARDQLVIGISQFPDNFNPKINSMAAKSYILAMARRPVTTFDADWNLICMLCTELPSMEKGTARYEKTKDGKDGVAVTYTLRPDARWGDGTPITTKDVVLSWQIGKHPVSGVSNAEFYRRIDRIEVKDDHTFTLHKNKRTCTFANANDFHIVPAHLEKPNFKDPKAYRSRSAYESDTTNPGLWFGPYRVAEVSPGSHVILERNPTWWGRKPAFDRVIVKVIQNTSAMTANLLAGGIDYVAGEVGMSLDQAMALKGRHGDRFNFVFKPSLVYEHIDVNLDNPILADRRVPAGRQQFDQSARPSLQREYEALPARPRESGEVAGRRRVAAARQRHSLQRQGRTAAAFDHDDGRQQDPRTRPAGVAKQLAAGRH
jgi:peptide/nickel transport system substrate-binding protein